MAVSTNIFPSFLGGYQAGEQIAQKRRQSKALMGAAQNYTAGNYDAIAPQLIAAGDVDDADAVSKMGYQQKQRGLDKTVGASLAEGDTAGAADTAFKAGDLPTGGAALDVGYKSSEHGMAMYTSRLQAGASLFGSLKSIPPEQRSQIALQRIKGTPLDTPEMEAKLASAPLDDASLDSYVQGAMTAHEQVTSATAQTVADARMTTAQANDWKAHHQAPKAGGADIKVPTGFIEDAQPPAPGGAGGTFTGTP